jgi:hypothetical protein
LTLLENFLIDDGTLGTLVNIMVFNISNKLNGHHLLPSTVIVATLLPPPLSDILINKARAVWKACSQGTEQC